MMRWKLALAAMAGLAMTALTATAADAAPGYTTAPARLRAGPGADYPTVARLRPGVPVQIFGCLDGWAWCDIGVGPDRGWANGRFLAADVQHRRRVIVEAAPMIGVPVIRFDAGPYWDSYYRGRPWYHDRGRWVH